MIDVEACGESCPYLVLDAQVKSVLNCDSHLLRVQHKLLVSSIIVFLVNMGQMLKNTRCQRYLLQSVNVEGRDLYSRMLAALPASIQPVELQ